MKKLILKYNDKTRMTVHFKYNSTDHMKYLNENKFGLISAVLQYYPLKDNEPIILYKKEDE